MRMTMEKYKIIPTLLDEVRGVLSALTHRGRRLFGLDHLAYWALCLPVCTPESH